MAKWGEGDPRWIVEERPDSTNVNNWHWTEYNCTPWAHNLLRSLLKGLSVSENGIEVKEIDELEGDITISNRKGKIKFYYELSIRLVLQQGSETTTIGRVKFTELTQDDQLDDYNYEISIDNETSDKKKVKDTIRSTLLPLFKQKMSEFNNEISKEFGQKVILPTKEKDQTPQGKPVTEASAPSQNTSNDSAKTNTSSKLRDVKTLSFEVEFLASAQDLFEALTNSNRVQIWTQSAATISAQPNSPLSLFGGNVTGRTLEAIPAEKIKQEWRLANWPADHHSTVTLTFEQGSSSTILKLKQEGVPSDLLESTKNNWHQYYFDRIKGIFGWGVLSSSF